MSKPINKRAKARAWILSSWRCEAVRFCFCHRHQQSRSPFALGAFPNLLFHTSTISNSCNGHISMSQR